MTGEAAAPELNPVAKDWIDHASYEELFYKWRFAPVGDPMFQGELGAYYSTVFARRRQEVGGAEHTRTSKKIGWEKR